MLLRDLQRTGFWPRDLRQCRCRLLHMLLVADRAADAHADDDLLQPRQREPILAAELLRQAAVRSARRTASAAGASAAAPPFPLSRLFLFASWPWVESVGRRCPPYNAICLLWRVLPTCDVLVFVAGGSGPLWLARSGRHWRHTSCKNVPCCRRPGTGRPAEPRLPHGMQKYCKFDNCTGISLLSTPPCGYFWLRRMCFLTRFTLSTIALPVARSTLITRLRWPRSLPAMTSTVSPVVSTWSLVVSR